MKNAQPVTCQCTISITSTWYITLGVGGGGWEREEGMEDSLTGTVIYFLKHNLVS